MNSLKQNEEQFSTLELQDTKGYSSRYMRSKQKTRNSAFVDQLPHRREKAAITIQKFWRFRMSMRRIFYQQMLEELSYEEQAERFLLEKQRDLLKGINLENYVLENFSKKYIDKKTSHDKKYMKEVAKECVAITFKFQKKMIAEKELKNFLEEKARVKERVLELKGYREELRSSLAQDSQQDQQVLLRQIREANAHLLKIVNEKNKLKHQLREKALQTSHQSLPDSII